MHREIIIKKHFVHIRLLQSVMVLSLVVGHAAPTLADEPSEADVQAATRAESLSGDEVRQQLMKLERMMEQQNKVIEHQNKLIDELRKKVDEKPAASGDTAVLPAMLGPMAGPVSGTAPATGATSELNSRIDALLSKYDEEQDKRLVPTGFQAGYLSGNGFYIRSVPDPKWENWAGDEKIPFELRLRGRMQLAYYNYHPTDTLNHQTNQPFGDAFGGTRNKPDFSALEVKRARLIFEGHAFDPDLKYRVQLNGDTRGLPGLFNNNHISSGSPVAGGAAAVEGGGVTVDHAVRLFEGWVSYDLHPACLQDCWPLDYSPFDPNYKPTLTLIAGKLKLLGPLEEYLGSGNEQFVEFSAASWFFSPDDDNLAVAAGVQSKMLEDRLYWVAFVTNGSESNFAANQIDDYPGFNIGLWYDFGGTWDEEKKRWKLFGDSMSDIDHSENLVVRVGGAASFAPMDRRALYGDAEQSRFRTVDGGARLIDVLNGAGSAINAVDRFNAYTFNTFVAGKYCGFSLSNEWWFRVMNDFETVPAGDDVIMYSDFSTGVPVATVFDRSHLFDFGTQLQGGYFIVPKKVELVGRWSTMLGKSGNRNDDFDETEVANEYTIGLNWFIRRHLIKWQTDFSIYDGGNPASASAAGFLTNRDGWLLRTQIQLAF